MTRRKVIGIICMVGIAAAIYLTVLILGGRGRTVEAILQKYQFTQLNPPSTLAPPGTLVTVLVEKPLVIGIICPPSESLGDKLQATLLTSDSSSSKEAEELTGNFRLTANGLQQLTGEVDSKFVKRIAVTFSNVKLIEISDSAVFQLIADRKDSCAKAVEFRRKNNQKVSMIKSVIQANARYQIEFESGLDATVRARVTSRIAGAIGLRIGEQSEGTVQGEGLYWGVRDDESLATISPNRPPATGAALHTHLLPTDRIASVIRNADEPK